MFATFSKLRFVFIHNNTFNILSFIQFEPIFLLKLQLRKYVPSAFEISNAKQDSAYVATLSKVLYPAFFHFLTLA